MMDCASMRYAWTMDQYAAAAQPAPAKWCAVLEQGEADMAAGRTVLLEPVLARLRESIARMEAVQTTKAAPNE